MVTKVGRSTVRRARGVRRSRQAGFSIIELLAVVFVIAIISGVMLVSNSGFGGQVLLENLAYDIAISVRQAQVYGISVQRFGTSIFTAGYGIRMETANPTRYILYGDAVTANGLYDCPTPGSTATCELVQSTTIDKGFFIKKLCAPGGTDSTTCTAVATVDILFQRPEPDAWISTGGLSCIQQLGTCYPNVRIVLSSPRGNITSVLVEANGQISVQKK